MLALLVFSLLVSRSLCCVSRTVSSNPSIANTTDISSWINAIPVNSTVSKLFEDPIPVKSSITLTSGHSNKITSLIALTSRNFASGSSDSSIKIWSPTTESLLRTLTGHTGAVNGLAALSGDGLASVGADGTLKIWSANSDSIIRTITVSSSALTAVATLTNGNVAVALSSDNTIRVYNPNDGAAVSLSTTPTHTSRINFLLTLSNGNLASASNDDTVKIWNSESGSLVRNLNGHTGDVVYLKEIGSDLASVSLDKKIILTDLTTGSTKTTINIFFTPYSVEYVLNKYLTVATSFGYIDFYDTTGKLVKTDKTSTKEIYSQLTLTSENLVIGDSIGTLRILKF